MDAATAAIVFGVILALVKILEKKYDKAEHKKNGSASTLTSAERKALYDTARHSMMLVEIGKDQTKILGTLNTRLAVIDERTRGG